MPEAAPAVPNVASDPSERLAETISRLTRAWIRFAREKGRPHGLSLAQLFLLGGLRELGSIPVVRWVDEMGVSPSSATGLLDGLEASGLLARRHDPADRRQVLVALTPRGERLAGELRREVSARWRSWCRGIPASELLEAAATLAKIHARTVSGEDGGAPPGRRRLPLGRRPSRRARTRRPRRSDR
jgi:DNA-binding MarR family transcriptional regulator